MRNIVEETYDKLINKWGSKEYKGIGTINCVPPIDYCEIISRIISLMRNKNDNIKILIVTDNWKRRTEIVDSLKNHNINIDTINILTHTYVNSRYNYSYDISIVVGVNEWNLSCNTVFNHARFKLMILTEKTIDTSMLTKIYNNIPSRSILSPTFTASSGSSSPTTLNARPFFLCLILPILYSFCSSPTSSSVHVISPTFPAMLSISSTGVPVAIISPLFRRSTLSAIHSISLTT